MEIYIYKRYKLNAIIVVRITKYVPEATAGPNELKGTTCRVWPLQKWDISINEIRKKAFCQRCTIGSESDLTLFHQNLKSNNII